MTYDPNFPPNLNISPLHLVTTGALHSGVRALEKQDDVWDQGAAIGKYGIAGRVWEATTAMTTYLTPPSPSSLTTFDPPCPLFSSEPFADHPTPGPSSSRAPIRRIIELGSGQSVASLHLAQYLSQDDELGLTDLPEVVPLCQKSIERYQSHLKGDTTEGRPGVKLTAAPLAWGGSLDGVPQWDDGPTHILLCDLIYFPVLYPPLIKTLLELTEPCVTSIQNDGPRVAHDETEKDDVRGPVIIMSYKPRSLSLEQPFFDAISLYFRMSPVIATPRRPPSPLSSSTTRNDSGSHTSSDPRTSQTTSKWLDASTKTHEEAEAFPPRLYILRRWRTDSTFTIPPMEHILSGVGVRGVYRGRDFTHEDQTFGAMEWD